MHYYLVCRSTNDSDTDLLYFSFKSICGCHFFLSVRYMAVYSSPAPLYLYFYIHFRCSSVALNIYQLQTCGKRCKRLGSSQWCVLIARNKHTHKCLHSERAAACVLYIYIYMVSVVLQCSCGGGWGLRGVGDGEVWGGSFPSLRWIMTLIPCSSQILKPPAAGKT